MLDKLMAFTLDLNRLDASTRAEVLKILNAAQKELAANLRSKDLTAFNKGRQAQLLKESHDIIEKYYEKAQMSLFETLEPLPNLVSKQTAKALKLRLPPSMEASIPTENVLKTLVDTTLVAGATTADWWLKQEADLAFRYTQAVKQGIVLNETNNQIIKRVADFMNVIRRNAAGLVQTSVASIANAARQKTFQANEDVIKGYRWVATFDQNVCELCIARSGLEWTIEGKPIGHGVSFSVPPIHYNDRCILTAVTKSFAELGFPDIPDPKEGQRASEDGPISAKTTFDDFLKRKGAQWQDETLGKGRADLWRSGTISLENLIDGTGKPLTIKELREKYS